MTLYLFIYLPTYIYLYLYYVYVWTSMIIFSCWFAVGDFVNVGELEGYQVLANNSLLLQSPRSQDEGWFRCTAANEGQNRMHMQNGLTELIYRI